MTASLRIKSAAPDSAGADNPTRIKSSAREIELKFLVNEADFKAIQASVLLEPAERRPSAARFYSVYFDTDK
jgi:hypothetical protein